MKRSKPFWLPELQAQECWGGVKFSRGHCCILQKCNPLCQANPTHIPAAQSASWRCQMLATVAWCPGPAATVNGKWQSVHDRGSGGCVGPGKMAGAGAGRQGGATGQFGGEQEVWSRLEGPDLSGKYGHQILFLKFSPHCLLMLLYNWCRSKETLRPLRKGLPGGKGEKAKVRWISWFPPPHHSMQHTSLWHGYITKTGGGQDWGINN